MQETHGKHCPAAGSLGEKKSCDPKINLSFVVILM